MSGSTLESSSGHLHILNHGNERQFLDLQNSVIASHRLRLFPAGFSKASIGAKVSLGFIPPEIPCNIIVGKFVGATGQEFGLIAKQLLRNLEHARSQSSKIFVDYTDHHLSLNNHFSIFYTDIFQIADQIIVTNETLHAALTQTYGYQKKINIIEDVNEFECRSSQAISSGQGATKILWFGHSSNLSYLIDFLEEWDPCSTNLQLVIVSSEVTMRILQDCRFKRPKNIKIQFIRWSVPNLEKAASMCQLCIVPANEKSVKRFASSNRLITALTLGLPTAATPLPSYKEFSKYFIHLNNDNLNRMIINPSTFQSGPERFQKNESKRFRFEHIIKRWRAILK